MDWSLVHVSAQPEVQCVQCELDCIPVLSSIADVVEGSKVRTACVLPHLSLLQGTRFVPVVCAGGPCFQISAGSVPGAVAFDSSLQPLEHGLFILQAAANQCPDNGYLPSLCRALRYEFPTSLQAASCTRVEADSIDLGVRCQVSVGCPTLVAIWKLA